MIAPVMQNNQHMNTDILPALAELNERLLHAPSATQRVFVGFDGFVDTIMKVVKQKFNYRNDYIKTIGEFADLIQRASGRSRQFELVTDRIKLGGNAPILFSTLSKFGVDAVCAGSLGVPAIHPVFASLDSNKLIPLANPGDSRALEFSDGKIILSELSMFGHYDWNTISTTSGVEKIRAAILESNLVAFVDWANLPFASDIWDGVLQNIIKPSGRKDFRFFFDLCDPSKKTCEQIDEVLDLIGCFAVYGDVTLGLNENETIRLWSALYGKDENVGHVPPLEHAAKELFNLINIQSLLVHPIDRTILLRPQEIVERKGRLVKEPKVLTGGGDNLNAGYIYGLLNSYPLEQCLLLAMATSGAYIQNGASPDIDAIRAYISNWMNEIEASPAKSPHVFMHRHE